MDNSSRVCVLSKQAAEQIVGYADCVGEDFSIDGMRYTIVGVLGERTSLVYGGSRVPRVYIPFTSFTRQYPQNGSAISEFTSPRRRARKWPTPRQPSKNSSMTFSATATASTSIP